MSQRPFSVISFLSLASGLFVAPWTQADELPEDLFFSTMPTVYSVSRLPQLQSDAPGFVTLIDREMIRASGARNLADLLRLAPGFQVSPPNADSPRVTYHGLSDEEYSPRLQVLVDGRSQYSPLFRGGVNWNLMPVALEDIERIEVIRGTNAAAYGSNAFLGVVNIITQDASQTRGLTVSVNHGNQGVRDEFVRWGGQIGNASVRISYQNTADNGSIFLPQKPDDPQDVPDDQKNRLFDLRADLPLTDQDELNLGLGRVRSKLDVGRADSLPEDPPRNLTQSQQYAQFGWRRSLGKGEEIQLRYYRSEEKLEDKIDLDYFGLIFDENLGGKSTRNDLELQHIFSPFQDTRLVWGLGSRQDKASAPIYYYGRGDLQRRVQRLFGNLEWRPANDWLLNLGGTWEHDDQAGSHFSPRLSASYHLTPEHTLRAGVSRAYRTPSFYETEGYIRLQPQNYPIYTIPYLANQVDAEKLTSYELGYYGEFPNARLSLDMRAFREIIPNRIVYVERLLSAPDCEVIPGQTGCGKADYAVNGESTDIRGLEYQLRWQPLQNTRVIFNQALIHIRSRLLDFETTYDAGHQERMISHTQASAPSNSSTLMLMQKLPLGMDFSFIVSHLGEMKWTTNSQISDFTRVDWRLAYPFRIGSTRAEIAYTAQSSNGSHAEFKESRLIKERHWLSLRLDL